MEKITLSLSIVISTIILALVANRYFAKQQVTTAEMIKNQAIDNCLKAGSYTWQDPNPKDATLLNTTNEPNRYWYKQCMQEKGYQTSIE